ncbi:GNAT family N-acetyltransferase [bacterium]|nr:GNAT family N-acetyltransferase [bacterium]
MEWFPVWRIGNWFDYDYDYEHEHEHERKSFGKRSKSIRPMVSLPKLVESAQWGYSRQVALAIGGKPIEGDFTRTIHTGVAGLDRIYVSELNTEDARAELINRMKRFRRSRTPFWLIHYDYLKGQAPREWLEAQGLRHLFDWRAMAADITKPLPPQANPPKSLKICKVNGPELLRVATDITAEAFSLHDTTVMAFRGMTNLAKASGAPFGIAQFIGYIGGEPLGSATMYADQGTAGIYWVGTLPAGRRRGVAEALVRHLIECGRAEGCHYAALQATPMGQGLYARLGFIDCCPIHVWGWSPE